MRILIAPDKFKGTLTALEACDAIHRGIERAASESGARVDRDICPIADGGEGTLDCIAKARGGELVRGPRQPNPFAPGEWISPRMLIAPPLPRTATAAPVTVDDVMLESADTIGMRLKVTGRNDGSVEAVSSASLGKAIAGASGCSTSRLTIGLGGTATVDGGIGMASELGVRFLDTRDKPMIPVPGSLDRIARVVPLADDHPIRKIEIIALCDVQNPLLGPTGAARMFGPQKGATPEQVERLEAGLENLVRVCRESGLSCDPDAPGTGAAGGLGFGLATFLGAKLVPGAAHILGLLGFGRRVLAADLIITGEGMLDGQTAQGKACAAVARAGARAGKPVIAVVGGTNGDAQTLADELARAGVNFASIHRLTDIAPAEQAMAHAGPMLEEATYRAVLGYLRGLPAHG